MKDGFMPFDRETVNAGDRLYTYDNTWGSMIYNGIIKKVSFDKKALKVCWQFIGPASGNVRYRTDIKYRKHDPGNDDLRIYVIDRRPRYKRLRDGLTKREVTSS